MQISGENVKNGGEKNCIIEIGLWDQVCSTAPLCSWINKMRKHGLVSTVTADNLSFRSTGPIWDLVTLGGHPDAPRDILHDLVMWLAPHLRTVQTEDVADQEGQGPLMWSPVSLTRSKVDFHYTDHTAGVVEYGPYSVSTKDGLVRIKEGDRRVGAMINHLSGEMESPDGRVRSGGDVCISARMDSPG